MTGYRYFSLASIALHLALLNMSCPVAVAQSAPTETRREAAQAPSVDNEPESVADKLPSSDDFVITPTIPLGPGVDAPRVAWDPEHVGDFKLIDQNSQTVTLESLKGRPWVANFIFTKCAEQCPAMCAEIRKLIKSLDADQEHPTDVRFVTITVDPDTDSPERMRKFADIFGADPQRWLFLSGPKDDVYNLIRHGFKVPFWENFGTARLPGMEFAHDMHLVHVDATGKIIGWYDSRSEREITLLRRVLQGRIETPLNNQPAARLTQAASNEPAALASGVKTIQQAKSVPAWVSRLPRTNASLNGLATILLLIGFTAIKAKRKRLHVRMMLFAFIVSIAFLACYLTYHFALKHYTGESSRKFAGTGTIAVVYKSILITHIILAMTVPVLTITTIYRAYKQRWDAHKRIARITFPIWLYVSVTGVVIYWMLYEAGWN